MASLQPSPEPFSGGESRAGGTGAGRAGARRERVPDGCTRVFAADGPLSGLLPGYAPRAEQRAMAAEVERAVSCRNALICEAGTGTGKTLAYLVPAIAGGGRIVISTGTRHLQERLFRHDLPLVCRALGRTPRIALLKGRSNYLCRWRYEQALTSGRLTSSDLAARLAGLSGWAARTVSGDLAEVSDLAEADPLRRNVTSTADNCLGSRCPMLDGCHVAEARRRAAEAEVVVVNHHLLLADMVLKEHGFADLLPLADTLIIDEAHQLPDLATRFFGVEVTSGQLFELARDTVAAMQAEAPDTPDVDPLAADLEIAVREGAEAVGRTPRRIEWSAMPPDARVRIEAIEIRLDTLAGALDTVSVRGPSIEAAALRARMLAQRLNRIGGEPAEPGCARWAEARARGFAAHLAPLDTAPALAERVAEVERAWILTSATLSVAGSLAHFAARVGMADAALHIFDGSFDYRRQTRCYLPPDMPEPSRPGYDEAVANVAVSVLAASRGRAFLLFTSHRALLAVRKALDGRVPWPLLTQGERPRGELLDRFVETADSVLLGTQSFWEGVDIRGDALSLVLIDKLPFAPPDDPLLRARAAAARSEGEDPFVTLQLPAAVIGLKQGVGRLIRDAGDRGVVVVCDPRLSSRWYGRVFLASLPPMPITRSLGDVRAFFAEGIGGAEGRDGGAEAQPPGAEVRLPGKGARAPGAEGRATGTGTRVPGAKVRDFSTGTWIPGEEVRTSGAGAQASAGTGGSGQEARIPDEPDGKVRAPGEKTRPPGAETEGA